MYIYIYIFILPTNCFQMILLCRYQLPPPPPNKKLIVKEKAFPNKGKDIPKDVNCSFKHRVIPCFDFLINKCTHSMHTCNVQYGHGVVLCI